MRRGSLLASRRIGRRRPCRARARHRHPSGSRPRTRRHMPRRGRYTARPRIRRRNPHPSWAARGRSGIVDRSSSASSFHRSPHTAHHRARICPSRCATAHCRHWGTWRGRRRGRHRPPPCTAPKPCRRTPRSRRPHCSRRRSWLLASTRRRARHSRPARTPTETGRDRCRWSSSPHRSSRRTLRPLTGTDRSPHIPGAASRGPQQEPPQLMHSRR